MIVKEGDSMALPESRKRANKAWDAEHMGTVACRLRSEDIEAFKKYAAENGTNVNALIRDFVHKCIGKESLEKDGK